MRLCVATPVGRREGQVETDDQDVRPRDDPQGLPHHTPHRSNGTRSPRAGTTGSCASWRRWQAPSRTCGRSWRRCASRIARHPQVPLPSGTTTPGIPSDVRQPNRHPPHPLGKCPQAARLLPSQEEEEEEEEEAEVDSEAKAMAHANDRPRLVSGQGAGGTCPGVSAARRTCQGAAVNKVNRPGSGLPSAATRPGVVALQLPCPGFPLVFPARVEPRDQQPSHTGGRDVRSQTPVGKEELTLATAATPPRVEVPSSAASRQYPPRAMHDLCPTPCTANGPGQSR
jgi:hypothetical protein